MNDLPSTVVGIFTYLLINLMLKTIISWHCYEVGWMIFHFSIVQVHFVFCQVHFVPNQAGK